MIQHTKKVLLLPGFKNSGAGHWQTVWEATQPFAPVPVTRLEHADWDEPNYATWQGELEQHLEKERETTFLVCHSLGCLNALSITNNSRLRGKISGALFVAPANPNRKDFPKQITGFPSPLDYEGSPPFPITLVASRNDPYAAWEWSQSVARHLKCRKFVDIGERGHINGDSGLGGWALGVALVSL
ncbi:hypothetical protein BASA81_012921 [Batrachochytrium salamandrivorans]|nr:hypothetical protein BASA81_012921 [Batrachochytrium salamandrivorans]